MLDNVLVTKEGNKIIFSTDNLNSIKEIVDILNFRNGVGTIIRVKDEIYRIRRLDNKTITIELDGDFEKVALKKSRLKEKVPMK